jgi:hypothetical protein
MVGAQRRETTVDRQGIEVIPKEHLRGIHEELGKLFRGIEASLDNHLARTEVAIAEALDKDAEDTAQRLAEIEKRLAALEAGR